MFCEPSQDPVDLGISIELNNIQSNFDNCRDNFSNCNFWMFGNAFDTSLTTLLLQTQNKLNLKFNIDAYIQKTSTVFNFLTNPAYVGQYWFDDFEWWSIALQRALSSPYEKIFSSSNIDLLKNMGNIAWNNAQLGTHAWQVCLQSDACAKRYNSSPTSNFEPLYSGGIWNNFFKFSTADRSTSDPYRESLGARENTVTNSMYAVYATTAIANGSIDPTTQLQYQNISSFLLHWVNDPSPLKNIFTRIDKNSVLIKERSFTSGDPDYDPTLAWAGDQGIMLGWLTAILNAKPTVKTILDKKTALTLAKQIINGAQHCLINQKTKLILSWTYWDPSGDNLLCGNTPGSAPGNDPQDYNTGVGVFIRYLTQAYQTNVDLRNFIQQQTAFPKIVKDEAAYLAGTTGTTRHTTCSEPSACLDLVDSTNKLAIYTADKVMNSSPRR